MERLSERNYHSLPIALNPNTLQMGFVYELPGRQREEVRNLFGDWQVNGVFPGTPLVGTAAQGALNAPGKTQTADQVKPTVEKLGGIGPSQPFFDPTAFA